MLSDARGLNKNHLTSSSGNCELKQQSNFNTFCEMYSNEYCRVSWGIFFPQFLNNPLRVSQIDLDSICLAHNLIKTWSKKSFLFSLGSVNGMAIKSGCEESDVPKCNRPLWRTLAVKIYSWLQGQISLSASQEDMTLTISFCLNCS